MLEEHSQVVLLRDLPDHGLAAGDIGVIVHVYADALAYEVEFCTVQGRTLDVVTLDSADVRPVSARDVLHARATQGAV